MCGSLLVAVCGGQLFGGLRLDSAADLWSLGVTLVEMACGEPPSDATRTEVQVQALVARMPVTYSEAYRAAVRTMLRLQPAARASAQALLNAPPFGAALAAQLSPSIAGMQKLVESFGWLAPLRQPGLCWIEQPSDAVGHTLRLADCSSAPGATAAERGAEAQLLRFVCDSPGNDGFKDRYRAQKTVLCDCRARSNSFAAKMLDLNTRLSNEALFSLQPAYDARRDAAARRAVHEWFEQTILSLLPRHLGLPNVRVLLVYHAAPSEVVVHQILLGGFAILQRLDDGWFGQGIYLTTDAHYAIDEYGQGVAVPLLVCAVLIGNMFPVIESP